MMTGRPPYTFMFDLGSLPEKGAELALRPGLAERAQIAAWLGIESLQRLEGSVKLSCGLSGRFHYRGHFDADVVQACVITLEPVLSHLSQDFERVLELVVPVSRHGRRGGKDSAPVATSLPDAGDDDAPERIDDPVIDLAAPLLEELSLSLDPYPRKAGASFTVPEDRVDNPADNPFSVLQKLKRS